MQESGTSRFITEKLFQKTWSSPNYSFAEIGVPFLHCFLFPKRAGPRFRAEPIPAVDKSKVTRGDQRPNLHGQSGMSVSGKETGGEAAAVGASCRPGQDKDSGFTAQPRSPAKSEDFAQEGGGGEEAVCLPLPSICASCVPIAAFGALQYLNHLEPTCLSSPTLSFPFGSFS